jgi:adenylyltransferase/sulfurtransferase
MLTPSELSRYSRQLVLPELGLAGQERLHAARVLVVGAGGLGSPVALYLAAAGVGTIGIVDSDDVETSNLHRQILHGTDDVGREKTASAAESLASLNPDVHVRVHHGRLTASNAATLLAEYDLAVDGSDNYETRYAINDACATLGRTWVYGSVERFSGQVSVFGAPDGPCYRCIFPQPPAPGSTASCEQIGVLGAVPGVVGSMQAVEALKILAQIGVPLVGRLLQLDLARGDARVVHFARRADCEACGAGAHPRAKGAAAREVEADLGEIEPGELARRLANGNAPVVLDVREMWERVVGHIAPSRHVPMGELGERVETLGKDEELVVYCHHGVRSAMAAEWLRSLGFPARSLVGGIDRWSREIDPAIPRY